jgi:(1->4)-alpha-D-glucan 1-alpha-D-glucosylmutase
MDPFARQPALDESAELIQSIFAAAASAIRREGPRIPRATYRVQLSRGFSFSDGAAILDYLQELGISDLYSSPFFKAREGSLHGYDLVDHNEPNPEIGTRHELDTLAFELRGRQMGYLLDFVPNHMGIRTPDNAWWMDVLENGPSSVFAAFFDIDWRPLKRELHDKVLLPVLGDHYGRVLEAGELRLVFDEGAFFVHYWDHVFPLNPTTYSAILEFVESADVGRESEAGMELSSIITGFRNLPGASETDPVRMQERRREKEVQKRRLQALVQRAPQVAAAISERVREINGRSTDPQSFDALSDLLEQQAYRLSYWRVASEEINYRRFFDVNELAAIHMENQDVFDCAHRWLFELLASRKITGVRLDHPDGLWDPLMYCRALQRGYVLARCMREARARGFSPPPSRLGAHCAVLDDVRTGGPIEAGLRELVDAIPLDDEGLSKGLYVIAEKILVRGESLQEDWPVFGTTGYDFAAMLGGLFVDSANEAATTRTYTRFIGHRVDFSTMVYQAKKLILRMALASELNVLAAALSRLAERDRHSRDFTLGALTEALREVIACFPVYRTYMTEQTTEARPHDRAAIGIAVGLARRHSHTTDPSVFELLRRLLMLEIPSTVSETDLQAWRAIVLKLQQLTGPVMAKGVEDTTFYTYNRLVSLNEVGGEPERFGTSVEEFHRVNAERQRSWPNALLATSTHDTKRGEDVRARISVLSELAAEWEEVLRRLTRAAEPLESRIDGQAAPDRNEQYLLYQTILGTLPFDIMESDPPKPLAESYVRRIVQYMHKAAREAKVNTSWVEARADVDEAMETFVRGALRPPVLFLLLPLARLVAFHGMWGSLSQVVLKHASPGVPDTYQGTELWDDSLVDPDNRRPIDYALRAERLKQLGRRRANGTAGVPLARELVLGARDGSIKLFTIHRALELRRLVPQVFSAGGEYLPLEATGAHATHVVAFERRSGDRSVVCVVPRLTARLARGRRHRPLGSIWSDTALRVPAGHYVNAFTEEHLDATSGSLAVARALAFFPVALLTRRGHR